MVPGRVPDASHPSAFAAGTVEAAALSARVARALESGDANLLGQLFPDDRKVKVSLDRIADLRGFVGSGPLVEALRRYVSSRTDVRFLADAPGTSRPSEPARVRGVLCSRDTAGRREKIGLAFAFERVKEDWRAVEIRETG